MTENCKNPPLTAIALVFLYCSGLGCSDQQKKSKVRDPDGKSSVTDLSGNQDVKSGAPATVMLTTSQREHCLSVLRDALKSTEFWPSMHASEGLTAAGYGSEVLAFLAPRLVVEQDDRCRCGIAREMVRAGDKKKVKVLLEILAGADAYGHVHAAESLYKVAQLCDNPTLITAFMQTDNMRLRLMAAGALGRYGNPRAMQVLRDTLSNYDAQLCQQASWILCRIGDERDIKLIRQNISRTKEPKIRSYLEHELAALGDPAGLRVLQHDLTSSDAAIRKHAAIFAADARAFSAADKLLQLLNDTDLDVRVRAAHSLLTLATPETSSPIGNHGAADAIGGFDHYVANHCFGGITIAL